MKEVLTSRLRLVPLRVEHSEGMFSLLSDPRIYEFFPDEPPTSLDYLRERYHRLEMRHSPDVREQWLNWIIQAPESNVCMGFIQATIHTPTTGDFAFVLGPSYWARGLAYDFHDYKAVGIDRPTLEGWVQEHGWETILNRAGTTFRKLDEADRQDLNADKAIALMLAQPSMIKRPVLDLGDRRLVGFKPEIYEAAL